jgi:hypothetical protein
VRFFETSVALTHQSFSSSWHLPSRQVGSASLCTAVRILRLRMSKCFLNPQHRQAAQLSMLRVPQLCRLQGSIAASSGKKRDTPGDPLTTSLSEHSHAQSTGPQLSILSPRRRNYQNLRCPVCLQTRDEWEPNHNPFNCVHNNGSRSAQEAEQCSHIAATRRTLQSLGVAGDYSVHYDGLDETGEPSPTQSDYQPRRLLTASSLMQNTNSRTPQDRAPMPSPQFYSNYTQQSSAFVDPRGQAARDHERAGYAAGVDSIRSSESRSSESTLRPDDYSSATSSYQPSSLCRSSSTCDSEPTWLKNFRSTVEASQSNMRQEIAALATQLNALAQSQLAFHQVHHRMQPVTLPPAQMPMNPCGSQMLYSAGIPISQGLTVPSHQVTTRCLHSRLHLTKEVFVSPT